MSPVQAIPQAPSAALQDQLEAIIEMIGKFRDENLRHMRTDHEPNHVLFHANTATAADTIIEKITENAAGLSASPQLSAVDSL